MFYQYQGSKAPNHQPASEFLSIIEEVGFDLKISNKKFNKKYFCSFLSYMRNIVWWVLL